MSFGGGQYNAFAAVRASFEGVLFEFPGVRYYPARQKKRNIVSWLCDLPQQLNTPGALHVSTVRTSTIRTRLTASLNSGGDMDTFRKGLLRTADGISLALQNAGKTFGFLADGRDLVLISDDENGRLATFPDHSDEGWPEVRVRLPNDAKFAYAASGLLTRVAMWKVGGLESEVLEELSLNTDAPPFVSRTGGGVVATLGSNASLTVKGATAELTLLSFKQVREPDAIRATIRNRAQH